MYLWTQLKIRYNKQEVFAHPKIHLQYMLKEIEREVPNNYIDTVHSTLKLMIDDLICESPMILNDPNVRKSLWNVSCKRGSRIVQAQGHS